MKSFLYALGFAVVGAGGGLVANQAIMSPDIGWWVLGGGALLIALVGANDVVSKVCNKVWPHRTDWEYTTDYHSRKQSFPDAVFESGKTKVHWKSVLAQEEGMFYKLDMQKERILSGVYFDHGSSNNVPEEWEIAFLDSFGGYVVSTRDGTKPFVRGKDTILIKELEKPVKAQYIVVTVKKVRTKEGEPEPYEWDIEDIKLRENRLFGRWWRRLIA